MITITEQILDMETQLIQAMLKSDVNKLDELIADDLLFTDHTGQVLDKASDIEAHRSGSVKIDSLQPSELLMRSHGNTVIVSLLMKIKGKYLGEAFQGANRYTRVWVKYGNAWKIVAGHSTVV